MLPCKGYIKKLPSAKESSVVPDFVSLHRKCKVLGLVCWETMLITLLPETYVFTFLEIKLSCKPGSWDLWWDTTENSGGTWGKEDHGIQTVPICLNTRKQVKEHLWWREKTDACTGRRGGNRYWILFCHVHLKTKVYFNCRIHFHINSRLW